MYESSLLPWFERHFRPNPETRFIFLTPPAAAVPHSSLVHMFDCIGKTFGGKDILFAGLPAAEGGWSLDLPSLVSLLRDSPQPLAVLGTAFSFVHLVDYCGAQKMRLKLLPGSRLMETGGYKGRSRVVARDELRRLMTKFLGVPDSHILTEYGMSEMSSQAYDGVIGQARTAGAVFRFPHWARSQVISPETGLPTGIGETGLLHVFDLANIWSIMAIQTEDLAVRRADGFELAGRVGLSEPRGCSLLAAP